MQPDPDKPRIARAKSPLARAIEIAKSGRCRTTADLFAALEQEGYQAQSVAGPWLMRLLRDVMDQTAAGSRRRSAPDWGAAKH
jgi:hypothetical protein